MALYFTTPIHLHTERGGFDRAVSGTPSSSDLGLLSGFPFPQGMSARIGLQAPPPLHSTRFRLRYYERR